MSLIGNGKSSVRNHFSAHRKTNLHLVTAEIPQDATAVRLENDQPEAIGDAAPRDKVEGADQETPPATPGMPKA
jgi:hypothetical protein